MLLAIDVGNTNIHVGLFGAGAEPVCTFCLGADEKRSADEYALLLSALSAQRGCDTAEIDGVIVGSVVPTLTGTVLNAVRSLTDAAVTVVGPGVKTGFSIRLADPSELGADLCANAAGALSEVGAPCIILDFGTATVVSALAADGAFAGASILPGIPMSFEALGKTGLLPTVSAGKNTAPVGRSTEDAIRSGVLDGQLYAVTGLAEQYRSALKLPKDTPVVISGGGAELLLSRLPSAYRHVPSLTLRGLREIYLLSTRKK